MRQSTTAVVQTAGRARQEATQYSKGSYPAAHERGGPQYTVGPVHTCISRAGGGVAYVVALPDIGIPGNAHFDFIERNSDQVAGVVFSWLKLAGL